MALQEQDEVRESNIAPWRRNRGQFEFLAHRRDYPDPLAAAQHEARTLALDNAHLVKRIESLETEQAHSEAERVIAVRSAWFWRGAARRARRSRRTLRALRRREWLMVALCALVAVLAFSLWLVAMTGA